MKWKLDKGRPLCPQICERVCTDIAIGHLLPGEKILSVREMALSAGINPNTVQKAFEQLEQQGILLSQRGSGWYVAKDVSTAKQTLEELQKQKTAEYVYSKRTPLGKSYAMDGEGINHGITYGKRCAATPDGRLAGDQLSKNLMPVFGCDKRGLLAYLNSATKIDAVDYPNGAPIDFILHPTAVEGDDGLEVMLALIRTTFKKGGSAVQCGIYSAELLLDAQEHPELHEGLQVRLCGWSQYFNKLSRDEQDMLIRQAKSEER